MKDFPLTNHWPPNRRIHQPAGHRSWMRIRMGKEIRWTFVIFGADSQVFSRGDVSLFLTNPVSDWRKIAAVLLRSERNRCIIDYLFEDLRLNRCAGNAKEVAS